MRQKATRTQYVSLTEKGKEVAWLMQHGLSFDQALELVETEQFDNNNLAPIAGALPAKKQPRSVHQVAS